MLSRVLAGSAVPVGQRSVLPAIKGLPWWGAVAVAAGFTVVGAAIDADSTSTLGRAFKICYLFGCLLAALAVRHRALFTAAAQPPLIAFIVGVTTLYTLNSDSSGGMKSVILKVVLPIANSFPWILMTFLLTLGVVAARWFLNTARGQELFTRAFGRSPTATSSSPERRRPPRKTTGGRRDDSSRERPSARRRPAAERTSSTREKKTTDKRAPAKKPAASTRTSRPDADRERRSAESATRRTARPVPPRRAAPQTIPARDQPQRRTAGQLRDNGSIEDLTSGLDDR